jgi:hypothetical protein
LTSSVEGGHILWENFTTRFVDKAWLKLYGQHFCS